MRLRITLNCVEFQAGDEVSGYVLIFDASLRKARAAALSVTLSGRSKARIHTSRGAILSDNRLFHSQDSLVRDKNAHLDAAEDRAPFRVPFRLCLDPNLPASFDSPAGSVVYSLVAKLSPSSALRPATKSPAVPLFLSSQGAAKGKVPTPRPYTLVKTKRVDSGWAEGGTIALTTSLPDGPRYEVGDTIRLSVAVNNQSRHSVTGLRAVLLQSTSYRARGTALDQQRRLDHVLSRAIVPKGRHLMFGEVEELRVPLDGLRSLESPCCSVRHAVEIHALRGGCRTSLCQTLPVEII